MSSGNAFFFNVLEIDHMQTNMATWVIVRQRTAQIIAVGETAVM